MHCTTLALHCTAVKYPSMRCHLVLKTVTMRNLCCDFSGRWLPLARSVVSTAPSLTITTRGSGLRVMTTPGWLTRATSRACWRPSTSSTGTRARRCLRHETEAEGQPQGALKEVKEASSLLEVCQVDHEPHVCFWKFWQFSFASLW